jgi:Tol biopolymer transport system component
MRALRVAAVVCAGALLQVPSLPPTGRSTLLTLPQHDLRRARPSPASVSLNADGRFIAFVSFAKLVAADNDDRSDIYVLDRSTGLVTLESIAADQLPIDGECSHPGLSGDGRYLVFETTLIARHEFEVSSIVLRDRPTDVSKHVSRNGAGLIPAASSSEPAISEDGASVAFTSTATDLVTGPDANGTLADVYLYRAATGTIARVSVDARGVQPPRGQSLNPRLSADGRFLAFASSAEFSAVTRADNRNASPSGRSLEPYQVYVRDMQLDSLRRVSEPRDGSRPDGASMHPAISRDGRYIAFMSHATNLVTPDRNRSSDVFLFDRVTAGLTMISRSAAGGSGNGHSGGPALSADERFVAFHSEASDLICARHCPPDQEDINLVSDVFLVDRVARATARISAGAVDWREESAAPALDAIGAVIAFRSRHPIDASDVAHDFDLFVYLTSGPSGLAAQPRR